MGLGTDIGRRIAGQAPEPQRVHVERFPAGSKPRHRCTVHLLGGEALKLPYGLNSTLAIFAQAHGGVVGMQRITGHGTVKDVLIPQSAIVYFEAA